MKRQVFFNIDTTIHNLKKGVKHHYFSDSELIQKAIKATQEIIDYDSGCGAYANWKMAELLELKQELETTNKTKNND